MRYLCVFHSKTLKKCERKKKFLPQNKIREKSESLTKKKTLYRTIMNELGNP